MKKLRCAILGYGDRSGKYSKYALDYPEELEVVAVIDVLEHKLQAARDRFNLSDDALFCDLEGFLSADIQCDFVINGTMDQMHYETSVKLLKKGYNMLLEKPITADAGELKEIQELANKNGCKVVVCHVLRYTMFYSKIKEIIDSGKLGKIMNIQMNEHVWHGHFINAYVRGKWRSESECGSGLLLAKCCHDTDLMCWLNNISDPEYVSSFGARAFYTPENAPEGSAEYCYNCPVREKCHFDAGVFELEKDFCPQYTWADINKPRSEITREEKKEFLKRDTFGKCVFKTDMDIVDRQCVSVKFKNGSVGTLNMVGGASLAGRHIHIICEYGEIVGYIEENKFKVRYYTGNYVSNAFDEETLDLNAVHVLESKDQSVTGHYGGDYFIMKNITALLRGEAHSASTTDINDSVKGHRHLLCYGAETARKENRVVSIEEI